MWGYDFETNLWVVRRNRGRIEHYDKMLDFHTWTVDLAELVRAPFLNPYDVPRARGFRDFLTYQASKGFSGFKTDESILKRERGICHPKTHEPYYHVMWPPTAKVKNFPILEPYPEHTLRNMEFWMFNETNSSAVLKLPDCNIVMMEPKHMMRFREHDIKKLARTQILTPDKDIFEIAAKEYTAFAAKIVRRRMWAGALAPGDVRMMVKIRNPRAQDQGGD